MKLLSDLFSDLTFDQKCQLVGEILVAPQFLYTLLYYARNPERFSLLTIVFAVICVFIYAVISYMIVKKFWPDNPEK